MPDGLEQCPHCGCHYPEVKRQTQPKSDEHKSKPNGVDKLSAEKQVNELIDAIAIKGFATDKERRVILRTAQNGGLDPDVVEIKLDAALAKVQQQKKDYIKKKSNVSQPSSAPGEKKDLKANHDSSNHVNKIECASAPIEDPQEPSQPIQELNPKGISSAPVVEETPVVRFCKKCGTRLSPGALFCKKCGTKLS